MSLSALSWYIRPANRKDPAMIVDAAGEVVARLTELDMDNAERILNDLNLLHAARTSKYQDERMLVAQLEQSKAVYETALLVPCGTVAELLQTTLADDPAPTGVNDEPQYNNNWVSPDTVEREFQCIPITDPGTVANDDDVSGDS